MLADVGTCIRDGSISTLIISSPLSLSLWLLPALYGGFKSSQIRNVFTLLIRSSWRSAPLQHAYFGMVFSYETFTSDLIPLNSPLRKADGTKDWLWLHVQGWRREKGSRELAGETSRETSRCFTKSYHNIITLQLISIFHFHLNSINPEESLLVFAFFPVQPASYSCI